MNEFELQSLIMQARQVKAADKFVMICILKNVDWSTWRGTVTLSYISKKYDINRRTLTRIIQRLKDLNWISIYTHDDDTRINVKIDNITLDKMSRETRQNDHVGLDKMSRETRQNDHVGLDKMSRETRQNVYHNNIINNNNINNNNDQDKEDQNSRSYYRDLYLDLYNVDMNNPTSYLSHDQLDFITRNNIKPSWRRLTTYNQQDLKRELSDRATCLNVGAKDFLNFKKQEEERELK